MVGGGHQHIVVLAALEVARELVLGELLVGNELQSEHAVLVGVP